MWAHCACGAAAVVDDDGDDLEGHIPGVDQEVLSPGRRRSGGMLVPNYVQFKSLSSTQYGGASAVLQIVNIIAVGHGCCSQVEEFRQCWLVFAADGFQ